MFSVIAYFTTYDEIIVGIWRGCPEQAIKKARGHAKVFDREITKMVLIGTAFDREQAEQIGYNCDPCKDGTRVR